MYTFSGGMGVGSRAEWADDMLACMVLLCVRLLTEEEERYCACPN
jgi:hypothetical protein